MCVHNRYAIPTAVAEPEDARPGDRMLATYFASETKKLSEACLAEIASWDDWEARRDTYRAQLREMLGLEPMPKRTPLRAVVTGKAEHAEFTVENLHFQSRPGLYVTGNLYVPKNLDGPAPAVLYVCGHSRAVKNGISYGNKSKYQRHGVWFARNGYVCLVIDTLQLGEIEGVHHGTHRQGMWWWNAAGYTPAGVEAWNSIRALDYLESRPEVDRKRLGVTGRSGGGAYSWYLGALDDRVKCSVPVAGITTLKNHVVDDCVEGHCDCMYMVNTYRWDYPQLAALTAPRALLIANSDQDNIFPLDGVLAVHEHVRRLYELAGERNQLGLNITVGPHEDTQVLQLHALQWMNHHLRANDELIRTVAEDVFEPEQLQVFDSLPADQINTRAHEVFTKLADTPEVPESREAWERQRDAWRAQLLNKCFAGWPDDSDAGGVAPRKVFEETADGVSLAAYDFASQPTVTLRLYVLSAANPPARSAKSVTLEPLNVEGWAEFRGAAKSRFADALNDAGDYESDERGFERLKVRLASGEKLAFVAPRGIGPTEWDRTPFERVHIRRRFMLLGQTLDGMRVWDIRRAVQAIQSLDVSADAEVRLAAHCEMAGPALYAALFEPGVRAVEVHGLPKSHRDGTDFLNVLRVLDMPQTVAMVAEKVTVTIHSNDEADWEYPRAVAAKLGFEVEITAAERDAPAAAK